MAFLDRKDHRRVDPSASSGPGRGSKSLSSGCGIDGCLVPGEGGRLLAKVFGEELPMCPESSEGEDATCGDAQREVRGLSRSGGSRAA